MKNLAKDYMELVWNPQMKFMKKHWIAIIGTYVITFAAELTYIYWNEICEFFQENVIARFKK